MILGSDTSTHANRRMDLDPDRGRSPAQGNRRRLLVFVVTLVLAMLVGQAWNFLRPSEYLASIRLQVSLPAADGPGPAASGAFAARLQMLDSRPLLAKLATRLTASGTPIPGTEGDPVSRLQSMLRVLPVPDSEVVQVQAVGTGPAGLADILNAVPDVLRAELAAQQAGAADDQLAAARQELARLERTVGERRSRLEAYRQQAGVLGGERDENESVVRSKGLNQSLNLALEKEAAAAARLKAIEAAVASGQPSSQVNSDATLNGLKTRAHQVREDLREMERGYTPEFMAMDPRARALRARLAELERQIEQQRTLGLQAALQTATEDQATAQATVERLRSQLAGARPALSTVSTRLSEAKALEEDLQQVEKARREMIERVARLDANERRRVATVTVLESAVAPTAPFRPDRATDAAYVAAVAFVLALLAVGTVELFNLAPSAPATTAPATIVLSPSWSGPPQGLARSAQDLIPMNGVTGTPQPGAAALPAPVNALTQAQAAALVTVANGSTRLACAAGLMGLTVAEMLALRPSDLDRENSRLVVTGSWARQLPLPDWLRTAWADAADKCDNDNAALLHDAAGRPLSADVVESMLASAALDAGLPQGAALRAEALRHTCIDWLVGQGMRFSDLARWVGPVDAGLLSAFSQRHQGVSKVDAGAVEFLMPALVLAPADAAQPPQARG
jgi:uncharacterized protein involved in exopolysaccharide biosynthesis